VKEVEVGEKPNEADERQKNWLASNFREGAGGEGEGAGIAVSDPGTQVARPGDPIPDIDAAAAARPGAPLKGVDVKLG
jgi:hypothetical protein